MARLNAEPRLAAFLDLIAFSEGTSTHPDTTNDGYDVIVTGVDGRHTFRDYSAHPFESGRRPIVVREQPKQLLSTASGRYQYILCTWQALAARNALTVFSPQNQDIATLQLLFDHDCSTLILSGHVDAAIAKLSTIWASFPGNLFGQGGKTLDTLLDNYARLLSAVHA